MMNDANTFNPSTRAIFLVGFMGSGKSTIGKLLAQRIGWLFVDLDALIEQEAGISIAEIFARAGEPAFRSREREMLRRILEEIPHAGPRVIALGGGTIAQPGNLEMLQQADAVSIWLDCPVEDLLMRCALVSNRPLFRDEASFRRLYAERLPYYRQASFRVESGKAPAENVVRQILSLSLFRSPNGREPHELDRPSSSTTAVS